MKRSPFKWTRMLALMPVLASFSAVSEPINCPKSVLEKPALSSVDKQWTVIEIEGERPLESAGLYLGSPAEFYPQVPDNSSSAKNKETVKWHVIRSEGENAWIGCSYYGTTAILYKMISHTAKECSVTYDLLPRGTRQRLAAIECK